MSSKDRYEQRDARHEPSFREILKSVPLWGWLLIALVIIAAWGPIVIIELSKQ